MKKLLSVLLIAGFTFGVSAQDKKIRAGLVTGFTANSIKVQTPNLEKNGTGVGFTIGMALDYNFNPNISLSTGIEFDLESFKLNYGSASNTDLDDVFYVWDKTDIYKYDFDNSLSERYEEMGTDSTAFKLMTRKFKSKYVTLPIFLKFQTNQIGSMKYYGKFGLRTSFLAGVRMDDEGFDARYTALGNFELTGNEQLPLRNDMKPVAFKKGLSAVRLGIGMYGGAEWNFTGNTSLFVEAGFNYGVNSVVYQNSSHLVTTEKIGNNGQGSGSDNLFAPTSNLDVKSNPQHTFELKVGLLF